MTRTLKHPLYAPYAERMGDLLEGSSLPAHAALDARYEEMRRAHFAELPPLHFAPVPKPGTRKRKGMPVDPADSYDGHVSVRATVPTRPGDVHDLYNFAVFMHFPRAKRALHARQLRARRAWIGADATIIPGKRTREQDALTLFDEGGIVLLGEPRETYGPDDVGTQLFVFGHAVLEHFALRDGEVHATALRVDAPADVDAVDRALARIVEDPARFDRPGTEETYTVASGGRFRRVPRARGPRP